MIFVLKIQAQCLTLNITVDLVYYKYPLFNQQYASAQTGRDA